jgi:hypothetical protein
MAWVSQAPAAHRECAGSSPGTLCTLRLSCYYRGKKVHPVEKAQDGGACSKDTWAPVMRVITMDKPRRNPPVTRARSNRDLFHTEPVVPRHPHVQWVRIVCSIIATLGLLGLFALPDTLLYRTLVYSAIAASVLAGIPMLTLRPNGQIHIGKVIMWTGILLAFGLITTIANSGGDWSWSPWLKQVTPNHQ